MARSSATDVAERLVRVATLIDDAAEHNPNNRDPVIIRIATGADDDDFSLGLRPVDDLGHDVVHALLGFVAPEHWVALGVMADGDAYAWPEPEQPRRVRAVHIVHRTGAAAWSLRYEGEPASRDSTASGAPPPEGAIDDVCRRALGCPTAPPEGSTLGLWAVLWLDAVVACAARHPEWSPSWTQVATLHPAVALLAGNAATAVPVADDPPLEAAAATHLGRLARVLARARPWEHLRRACAGGSWPIPFIPAAHAAWMDEGMFSRWVLDAYPSVGELAGMAAELVPDQTARRIAELLAAWEPGP